MSHLPRWAAATSASFVLSLAAASPSLATPPPADLDDFYAPPASEVVGTAGTIVWSKTIPVPADPNDPTRDPVAVKDAATTTRIIYRSENLQGAPIVQSATVLMPAGSAPVGGWKIVSWNHVTTGGADYCAPSRATKYYPIGSTRLNTEFERLTRSNDIVNGLLRRGLVVVRPDYEGIGTPGPHPYLIGESLARSNTDAVRAVRTLVPSTSNRWAVAGQSEGGIAALWTSAKSAEFAPELELEGTLAATPPVNVTDMIYGLAASLNLSALTPLAALTYNGAMLARPTLAAGYGNGVLSTVGYTRMADLETRCLADLDDNGSLGGLTYSQWVGPNVESARTELYAEVNYNDAQRVPVGPEPLRFYAGGLDLVAPQTYITDAYEAQKKNRTNVTYKKYPLATHVNLTDNFYGGVDIADWLKARLN